MPLILGVIAGFLSSTPVGPISLAVLSAGMRHGYRHALATGLGSVAPNLLYACLALWGVSWVTTGWTGHSLKAAGAISLLAFGAYDLAASRAQIRLTSATEGSGSIRGAVLCLTNPFCLVYWLAVIAFLRSHGLLGAGRGVSVTFLAGAALGDVAWFLLMARIGARLRRQAKLDLLRRLNAVVSAAFIGIALYWSWDLLGLSGRLSSFGSGQTQ